MPSKREKRTTTGSRYQERTEEQLLTALSRAEREIARLKARWSKGKQSEHMLKQLTYDLGERVKELNCLYSISSMVEKQGVSLDEILQGTVDIIPDAWQYPDVTCGRIILENRVFKTRAFTETPWKQSQHIVVNGTAIGSIEVFYIEEKPEKDEGPHGSEGEGD